MFETSTLVSLGLTAILCGIIMFYCKRLFAQYDRKLESMSDLISTIITQLNQIPAHMYDNSSLVNGGGSGYYQNTNNLEQSQNAGEQSQYVEQNVEQNVEQDLLNENVEYNDDENNDDRGEDSESDYGDDNEDTVVDDDTQDNRIVVELDNINSNFISDNVNAQNNTTEY